MRSKTQVICQCFLTADLQALAAVKYDSYEGYRPGVKFIKSLAVWLDGFEPAERDAALAFVRTRLVYVSAPELERLILTVYPDLLRRELIRVAASAAGLPEWRVRAVVESKEFAAVQRRMLVLGMSDGARLDRLRRASPLSTEQFHLVTQLDERKALEMRTTLATAMDDASLPGDQTFASVVLVDDFAASGTSMLRPDPDRPGAWKGKLVKARERLDELCGAGVIAAGAPVTVLVYLMSDQAWRHLSDGLAASGLEARGFRLLPGHVLPPDLPLRAPDDDPAIGWCRGHYRSCWANEHTGVGGDDFALGYGGCALPLVLHHNTPNNSPPVLWRDEVADPPSEPDDELPPWVGLFPRHERHHPRRP